MARILTRHRYAPVAAALALHSTVVAGQLRPEEESSWAIAAAALTVTVAADAHLRDALRDAGGPVLHQAAQAVEPLGRSRVALTGLAASYATARLAGQPAWARATVRVAAGYVVADAVSAVLKPVVNRARPAAGLGPYAFHDAAAHRHRHSFPSSHATHAFALAAGISAEARRPWVTELAYGTATLVAWSRVHDDAHWSSDVVAGSVVGMAASLTTIGWLERRERGEPESGREGDPARRASGATALRPRLLATPTAVGVTIRF